MSQTLRQEQDRAYQLALEEDREKVRAVLKIVKIEYCRTKVSNFFTEFASFSLTFCLLIAL